MEHLSRPGTKVFVATGFAQKKDAQRIMAALEAKGHAITWDWTRPPSGAQREQLADADADGVKAADVVVVVMTLPQYEYAGTWTEVGIAIGAEKPILFVSPFADASSAKCAQKMYFARVSKRRVASSVEEFIKKLA